MFLFLKNIASNFEQLDCFGYKIEFFFERKTLVKSKFGATITVFILLFSFYLFVLQIHAWQNNDSLQTTLSTKQFSARELLKIGENYTYPFSSDNYYPNFILKAFLPNGSLLNYLELQRYFNPVIYYYDSDGIGHFPETELCPQSKLDEFLQFSQEIITEDSNRSSYYAICIKESFLMGMFMYEAQSIVKKPYMYYAIDICRNSSKNQNFCASEEEIVDMITYIFVQINVPQSSFDFSHPKNPRKRNYDSQSYSLDYKLMKTYVAFLAPVLMKTDHGLFWEDYEEDSVDFNTEKLDYQINIRGANEALFVYGFEVGFSKNVYFRRNIKFKDIIANIGGIMNIMLLFGKVLCMSYNSKIFQQRMFNSMNIDFGEETKKTEGKIYSKKSSTLRAKQKFRFSLFSVIFPAFSSKPTYHLYLKAMNSLCHNLDIQVLLKRMSYLNNFDVSKKMEGFSNSSMRIRNGPVNLKITEGKGSPKNEDLTNFIEKTKLIEKQSERSKKIAFDTKKRKNEWIQIMEKY